MPTKIELTLEQSQQGVSNDVLAYGLLNGPGLASRGLDPPLSWKPCQGDSLNLPDHRISHWYKVLSDERELVD
ncbi:hypothetical protein Tco_0958034 [Tanacetum coccineum]